MALEIPVDRRLVEVHEAVPVGPAVELSGEQHHVDVATADPEALGRLRRADTVLHQPRGHQFQAYASSSKRSPSSGQSLAVINRRQLERLVTDYIAHYNQHRPHRSLNQRPPQAVRPPTPASPAKTAVLRSSRCHGLINEYANAA